MAGRKNLGIQKLAVDVESTTINNHLHPFYFITASMHRNFDLTLDGYNWLL